MIIGDRFPATAPLAREVDAVFNVRRAVRTMPAVPEAVPTLRRFTRAVIRRWGLPDNCDEALAVIVTELVANAVKHSGSPDVAVLLATDGTVTTLQVKDTGRWRSPDARHRGTANEVARDGRGLRMVEAYATAWALRSTSAGTRVVVKVILPGC